MPRPGPRPYECVRRAWHSERHHSMRGTLIQEMFRLVSARLLLLLPTSLVSAAFGGDRALFVFVQSCQ